MPSRRERHERRELSAGRLVAFVGCLLMLQPFATDFYLASLPGLARTFATSAATVQLTLSVFVLTFGVMQLVVGPLSDRFGRHPVLVTGLALYAIASVACALAPSIDVLIAARWLQAVGCCTAVVIARAVMRDRYEARDAAHALAQASTVLAFGAVVGPVIGSLLEVTFGFRATFVVLTLVSAALLAATLAWLPETNRHRDRTATRSRPLIANYGRVLRSREFLAYTLVGAASYAGLFAFISGSSLVMIEVLGVPTRYFGFTFAFGVAGYLAGTLICRRLVPLRGVVRTLKVGAVIAGASGIGLAALALAGVHHWLAVLLPQCAYFLAHGINFPCAQSGSVAPFPRNAGAAAGLFGFLMMLLAAPTGWLIGATSNGTVYPMSFTVAALALLVCTGVFGWVARLPRAA